MVTVFTSKNIADETEKHSSSSLHTRISVAAYYKAELRTFALGHDLDDWLEAEQDVLSREGIIHSLKSDVKEMGSTA